MTDTEITALAREYGEYVANSLGYDLYPDPELRYRLVAKAHSESAQLVLEWLLQCYCLVEKAKAKQFFQSRQNILKHQDKYDRYIVDEASVEKRLMLCLFPEVANEVES